jgi:hypothetical protein
VPLAVCGPSNIGNLLAARGVPTICGLGGHGRERARPPTSAWSSRACLAVYRGYFEGGAPSSWLEVIDDAFSRF